MLPVLRHRFQFPVHISQACLPMYAKPLTISHRIHTYVTFGLYIFLLLRESYGGYPFYHRIQLTGFICTIFYIPLRVSIEIHEIL